MHPARHLAIPVLLALLLPSVLGAATRELFVDNDTNLFVPGPGTDDRDYTEGVRFNVFDDHAVLLGWETRVPTGRLNAFLGELVAAHPHPIRGGKQPRILFGTQAGTKPPRFVLSASGFIEAGYRRFIERRLREEFGFEGTPVHISVRVREKRSKKK